MRISKWIIFNILVFSTVIQAQVIPYGFPSQRSDNPVVYLEPAEPLGGLVAIQSLIVYPDTALALQLEGTVVVRCVIDVDGRPKGVLPILGPELLFNAAIDAVELSHWDPARLYQEPIEYVIEFGLDFHLPGTTQDQDDVVIKTHNLIQNLHRGLIITLVLGLVLFVYTGSNI